ncbi:hypothetical protein RF11_05398 [Thelohanellus kitauei]|uniref:Uncharacterized protein n=1 Tax=Thelohanellus kitauei TaxID=669202 RepID=A0A0C2IQV8_THEKT|nr:hypothetical protein RF11_05398 [Thelohanellus kitauei]
MVLRYPISNQFMKFETIILIILSVAASYSTIIEHNQELKIYHSYDELEAQKSKETVFGRSYDIFKRLLDIGTKDGTFTICLDKQDKLIYVLAFDSRQNEISLGLFMINISTHKFYKIKIAYGEEREPLTLSRIWCAYGGFYGYDEETDLFVMKKEGDNVVLVYQFNDKLDNFYLDESEKNNLALLTQSKEVNCKYI